MADNTLQYEWIVTIKGNLDVLYRDRPDVFVAGDHLIYAVRGDPKKRRAPDAYVAFGRPKGHRGSYKVWEESGIFPQVLFEVLSPNNTAEEMRKKKLFYRHFGAEEYYVLDPDAETLVGWLRRGNRFVPIPKLNGFVSPRLGIRFETGRQGVRLYYPDGSRFLSFVEVGELAATEKTRADTQQRRADAEQSRADTQQSRADAARLRADAETAARARLAAKLRELGIDPDSV